MGRSNYYHTPWYKNWKVWLGIIIAMVVISNLGSKDEKKEPAGTVSDTAVEVAEQPESDPDPIPQPEQESTAEEPTEPVKEESSNVGTVGSTITYDDVSLTLTNIEVTNELSILAKADPGKTYVVCYFSIANNSNKDFTFNSYNFDLIDSRKQKLSYEFTASTQVPGWEREIELLPGGSAEDSIVFMPTEGGECTLIWNAGFFNSTEAGKWTFSI